MITVSYALSGLHIVRDFNSLTEFHKFCDEVNPFDSPFIMEIFEIIEY